MGLWLGPWLGPWLGSVFLLQSQPHLPGRWGQKPGDFATALRRDCRRQGVRGTTLPSPPLPPRLVFGAHSGGKCVSGLSAAAPPRTAPLKSEGRRSPRPRGRVAGPTDGSQQSLQSRERPECSKLPTSSSGRTASESFIYDNLGKLGAESLWVPLSHWSSAGWTGGEGGARSALSQSEVAVSPGQPCSTPGPRPAPGGGGCLPVSADEVSGAPSPDPDPAPAQMGRWPDVLG